MHFQRDLITLFSLATGVKHTSLMTILISQLLTPLIFLEFPHYSLPGKLFNAQSTPRCTLAHPTPPPQKLSPEIRNLPISASLSVY